MNISKVAGRLICPSVYNLNYVIFIYIMLWFSQ